MKIAYLGIDLLMGALEAALDAGCEVMKVFTCPTDNVTEFNTGVLDVAHSAGIPATEARITRADLNALAEAGCELLLCAGHYYRVPITRAFPMINVHPAPLPCCRGAWPMPLILLGAHGEGGVALHKMEREFDAGDIIMQRTFPLGAGDTLEDYMRNVDARVPDMVRDLVRDLPGWLSRAVPQGEGRYLPNPDARAWTVRSDMSVDEADRVLRAFYGYECIYVNGSERYELVGGRAVHGRGDALRPFALRDGHILAQKAVRVYDAGL